MLQLKEKQYVTVWNPREAERMKNTIEANISSSKKIHDNEYTYYSWNAKFVGKAYELAKHLEDKDRIILTSAAIENYYDIDKKKLYVTVVVFEFEKVQNEE